MKKIRHRETQSDHTENITPEKDRIFDDPLPSNPYRISPTRTHGRSAEQLDSMATLVENATKGWERRFEKKIHFEKFPGSYGGDYQLLFFQKDILVSLDDVARALTYVAAGQYEIEYEASEILEALAIREFIEVPGPEIPASFDGAVRGFYIPLELMCALFYGGELSGDASELAALLDEFENRKAWHRVARLQDATLGERKLRDAKWSEAKQRSEKRKP